MSDLTNSPSPGDDFLLHQTARPVAEVSDETPTWFDRFYQCLLSPDRDQMLVMGVGVYPNNEAIDGYACLVHDGGQRNLRFADHLGGDRLRTDVGPLRWRVTDPMKQWHSRIGPNPEGFELDATWTARSRPWMVEPIAVGHDEGSQTEFAHYFQAGRWQGELVVDGERIDLDGWTGPRDRSWGVRRTRDRLGMHVWIQAQFGDECVSVHYNEFRDGSQQHCDGAVIGDDDSAVAVTAFAHDFEFAEDGEFLRGKFEVTTADGESIVIDAEGRQRGLYMAGAGYGGWHGARHDGPVLESEQWPLDGSRNPGNLSLGLADKPCDFERNGQSGGGIFEIAVTRSSSYTYRPTLGGDE